MFGVVLIGVGAGTAAIGIKEDLADRFLQPHAERQHRWGLNRKVYFHLNYLRWQLGCGGIVVAAFGLLWLVTVVKT